jgi:hypothetical protein
VVDPRCHQSSQVVVRQEDTSECRVRQSCPTK